MNRAELPRSARSQMITYAREDQGKFTKPHMLLDFTKNTPDIERDIKRY